MLGGEVNILAAWTSAADVHVVVDRSRGSKAAGVLATVPGVARPDLTGVALVTAIGEGVAGEFHRTPGKVLRKSRGIIATPGSLTFVVPDATGLATLRTLHEAFVATRRRHRLTPTRRLSGSRPMRQR